MVIRIGKIHITPGFVLLAATVYFLDTWIMFPTLLLSIAAHELGHILALRLCGVRIERIYVRCIGFRADYNGMWLGYKGELLAAAAGPAVTLVLAAASAAIGNIFSLEAAYFVAGVNLLILIFNILPIRPLDGGQILNTAVTILSGTDKAERVSAVCDRITAALMFIAGTVLLIISGGNFTLLLITIFVVKSRKIV